MAREALIAKAKKKPKFTTRIVRRCEICGRKHGYMRRYGLCRVCFRQYAVKGEIPGLTKSSW